jgi:hypothetical protein
MGIAFKAQGKLKEATKLLTEVYEGRKAELGEEHEETLETLQVLEDIKN